MVVRMTRAALAFVCALAVACDDPFEDAACTLEARSYPIAIARDVPFAFADAAKLKVEACATRDGQTPTCAIVVPAASGESLTLGSPTEAAVGMLTKAADGSTKLALTVHVGEGAPGSTTIVRVRVLDGSDREITKDEGPVRWSDDSCHPTPNTDKL